MKNMKIIIALVLGATGSAALPIPKTVALSIARTAAKHSAAAAAGVPKKAFALDQIVVQAVVPVEQDDSLPATIARRLTGVAESGVAKCEDWCGSHTDEWDKKCGWEDCAGCRQCGGPRCEPWCSEDNQEWSKKCWWDTLACLGCSQCEDNQGYAGPRCMPWCASDATDWTDKCADYACATCPQCPADCAAAEYVKETSFLACWLGDDEGNIVPFKSPEDGQDCDAYLGERHEAAIRLWRRARATATPAVRDTARLPRRAWHAPVHHEACDPRPRRRGRRFGRDLGRPLDDAPGARLGRPRLRPRRLLRLRHDLLADARAAAASTASRRPPPSASRRRSTTSGP